jgi:hypothetical protein
LLHSLQTCYNCFTSTFRVSGMESCVLSSISDTELTVLGVRWIPLLLILRNAAKCKIKSFHLIWKWLHSQPSRLMHCNHSYDISWINFKKRHIISISSPIYTNVPNFINSHIILFNYFHYHRKHIFVWWELYFINLAKNTFRVLTGSHLCSFFI